VLKNRNLKLNLHRSSRIFGDNKFFSAQKIKSFFLTMRFDCAHCGGEHNHKKRVVCPLWKIGQCATCAVEWGEQNIEASFICIDENNRLVVKEMKAHSGSYTNQEDKSRDETVESLGPYTNQEDESRVASVESLGPYTNQEDESHVSSMDSVGLDTNDENDSQASSCESVGFDPNQEERNILFDEPNPDGNVRPDQKADDETDAVGTLKKSFN